jgi:hypothetical protein
MTDSERIAYLLDKLAACERDNAATIADLRKQVDGLDAMYQRASRWWTEEKDAHAATKAKLAVLEGGAK